MTWKGYIGRSGGELRHDSDPDHVLALRVGAIQKGKPVEIRGDGSEKHWVGEISIDRTRFWLTCQFGFRLKGSLRRGVDVFEVVDCEMIAPEPYKLPGEA